MKAASATNETEIYRKQLHAMDRALHGSVLVKHRTNISKPQIWYFETKTAPQTAHFDIKRFEQR